MYVLFPPTMQGRAGAILSGRADIPNPEIRASGDTRVVFGPGFGNGQPWRCQPWNEEQDDTTLGPWTRVSLTVPDDHTAPQNGWMSSYGSELMTAGRVFINGLTAEVDEDGVIAERWTEAEFGPKPKDDRYGGPVSCVLTRGLAIQFNHVFTVDRLTGNLAPLDSNGWFDFPQYGIDWPERTDVIETDNEDVVVVDSRMYYFPIDPMESGYSSRGISAGGFADADWTFVPTADYPAGWLDYTVFPTRDGIVYRTAKKDEYGGGGTFFTDVSAPERGWEEEAVDLVMYGGWHIPSPRSVVTARWAYVLSFNFDFNDYNPGDHLVLGVAAAAIGEHGYLDAPVVSSYDLGEIALDSDYNILLSPGFNVFVTSSRIYLVNLKARAAWWAPFAGGKNDYLDSTGSDRHYPSWFLPDIRGRAGFDAAVPAGRGNWRHPLVSARGAARLMQGLRHNPGTHPAPSVAAKALMQGLGRVFVNGQPWRCQPWNEAWDEDGFGPWVVADIVRASGLVHGPADPDVAVVNGEIVTYIDNFGWGAYGGVATISGDGVVGDNWRYIVINRGGGAGFVLTENHLYAAGSKYVDMSLGLYSGEMEYVEYWCGEYYDPMQPLIDFGGTAWTFAGGYGGGSSIVTNGRIYHNGDDGTGDMPYVRTDEKGIVQGGIPEGGRRARVAAPVAKAAGPLKSPVLGNGENTSGLPNGYALWNKVFNRAGGQDRIYAFSTRAEAAGIISIRAVFSRIFPDGALGSWTAPVVVAEVNLTEIHDALPYQAFYLGNSAERTYLDNADIDVVDFRLYDVMTTAARLYLLGYALCVHSGYEFFCPVTVACRVSADAELGPGLVHVDGFDRPLNIHDIRVFRPAAVFTTSSRIYSVVGTAGNPMRDRAEPVMMWAPFRGGKNNYISDVTAPKRDITIDGAVTGNGRYMLEPVAAGQCEAVAAGTAAGHWGMSPDMSGRSEQVAAGTAVVDYRFRENVAAKAETTRTGVTGRYDLPRPDVFGAGERADRGTAAGHFVLGASVAGLGEVTAQGTIAGRCRLRLLIRAVGAIDAWAGAVNGVGDYRIAPEFSGQAEAVAAALAAGHYRIAPEIAGRGERRPRNAGIMAGRYRLEPGVNGVCIARRGACGRFCLPPWLQVRGMCRDDRSWILRFRRRDVL